MNRLTPNLWALSTFQADTAALRTRELDFNLARRSAIIINRVIGQMFQIVNTTSGHGVAMALIQELDTDPDNVDIDFAGDLDPDGVILDSSRCFRHVLHQDRDTAAGAQSPWHSLMEKDWTNEPESKRPISITALRHHLAIATDIAQIYWAELHIDYFIVELSLEEIGIINASRR